MSDEAWYDSEIAPKLLELARQCQERGMSFVACVEYAPGETSETTVLADGASIKPRMAYWAVKARGNADSLIGAMLQHPGGHQSVYLRLLQSGH